MTNREFMLYKAEIEAACLERVLFPVFSADHVLFRCVDNKGVTRPVIAMLHSWVADFQEQLALAGLIGQLGCGERIRRAVGRVGDGAEGAEQPDGTRTPTAGAQA